ncbi:MAG: hypothetical protein U1A24_15155 [Cypionkella sp.]|uniref:hypothetical protein n=1 Tax=Cypionkella sp. TaxID=2811411 RepID=UPI002ABB4EB6|nr:hypothetical protein [Cypionkella sp.]MDZ4311881.1 hypothetical protein [Cypionkella sp.]
MNIIKLLCIPLTVLALSAGSALADGKGHGNKKPKAHHATQFCPPGLAKKSRACIPPGQAKKQARQHHDDHADKVRHHDGRNYRVGDRAPQDCLQVSHTRYKSLPSGTYCRYDNHLMRIDPKTNAVLSILRVLTDN